MDGRRSRLGGVVAVALLVLGSAARADEPPPAFSHDESPYRLRLDVDIPAVVLGLTLWVSSSLIGNTPPPSYCGTSTTPDCDPKALNALDRLALGHIDPAARTAADVLSAVPALYLAVDIFDVGPKHWRTYLTDLWMLAEVMAWNGAFNDIVRRAVHRPRPYLYTRGAYPADRDGPDAALSFYSGHTSFAFSIATAAAYTFTLRHPHGRLQWLVWPGLLAVASLEPLLRVLSGDHFPTDVMVAAVVGSAIGILVPALHRRSERSPPRAVTGWRLVPSATTQATTLSLVGSF